ncbi:hypothetical protein IJF81_04110, partial [bacterium]|nr:hypothetical protein [bacterium]
PNKIGQDVRTLNSLFGYVKASPSVYGTLSESDCKRLKNKLGINECPAPGSNGDPDYWGGAVKYCHDRGLHLPSEQTLATLTGSILGRSDITPKTVILENKYDSTSSLTALGSADYWSSVELSAALAMERYIYTSNSRYVTSRRNYYNYNTALCVGD